MGGSSVEIVESVDFGMALRAAFGSVPDASAPDEIVGGNSVLGRRRYCRALELETEVAAAYLRIWEDEGVHGGVDEELMGYPPIAQAEFVVEGSSLMGWDLLVCFEVKQVTLGLNSLIAAIA